MITAGARPGEETREVAASVPVSAPTIELWRSHEEASFEDCGGPDWHPYALLGRRKTRVVVETEREARDLIESALYRGIPSGFVDDSPGFQAALRRVAAALEEAVEGTENGGRS